jgi:Protein of unknown function (DUF3795)
MINSDTNPKRRKRMTDEKIKESIAPCGLCCETCFAHVDGDIRKYSMKLKEKLGNFHVNAKRFETLLDDPIFKKYTHFKEMLDYFASENCKGCRNEQCKLFKGCGVRKCHQEKQIDFCYQCDQFPCDRTNFDPGLYKGWVAINKIIQKKGIEKYHEEARVRSRYP